MRSLVKLVDYYISMLLYVISNGDQHDQG